MVSGILNAAMFKSVVSAHEYEDGRTLILIKFDKEVIRREKREDV